MKFRYDLLLFWSPRILTSVTYAIGLECNNMSSDKEKETQIAEYFLKSFEEKSPLYYDILDSMFTEKKGISQVTKNYT